MRYEQDNERKITALKAQLSRQSKLDSVVLAIMAALSVSALAVLLGRLLGLLELPDLW